MTKPTTIVALIPVCIFVYLFPAAVAGAATCGTKDATSGQPVKGALTLDDRSAVTEAAFKRDTGHKTLALMFNVTGCELAGSEPRPAITIIPRQGIDDLPSDAVTLKSATPDGSSLDILLDVNSDGFDPGAYGGFVVLRAPYLTTTRTPVAVSRSDDRWLIPLVIGLFAAAGGFAVWTITRWISWLNTENRQSPRWSALGAVFGFAVIGGGVAAVTSWLNQDVWTVDDNGLVTASTAFVAATSGALAALLAKIWPEPTGAQPADAGAGRSADREIGRQTEPIGRRRTDH
jgi:hypothetical protein